VALIGASGMCDVYKARDMRLDRTVAVKILPPHLASDYSSVNISTVKPKRSHS